MARRPVPAVAEDFSKLVPWLKERGIMGDHPSQSMSEVAKRIHRATYSLILWRFRLKRLPDHAMAFIEEIASDALQVLPQVLMGYAKTGKLLTRGILENTLRHIYFSDHRIEFARMNADAKWYVRVSDLLQYAAIHPRFSNTEVRFDAISRISTLHSELSAAVHGRTVRDLEMRSSLDGISYLDAAARAQMALIERTAESCNFALAVFRKDEMALFEREDRRIILQTMSTRAKGVLREFEP